jgi:hypothetical protein
VARSVQDRRDASDDKGNIRPEASRPYNHRGMVVTVSVWLAFYVVVTIIYRPPTMQWRKGRRCSSPESVP